MPIVVSPTTDTTIGEAVTGSTEGHVETGLGRLIARFKGKPNVEAFLRSYLEQIQELEDAIWFVMFGRMVDYAEGVYLDRLGKVVGQERAGLSDDRYRVHIRARIRINQSFGKALDIQEVISLIDPAAVFHLRDYPIASFAVWFEAPPVDAATGQELPKLVAQTRAAGVSGLVSFPVDRATNRGAFFGSVYDPTLNAARGFSSSYDSTVGGLFGHAART